ncbi:MAG: hydrogenase nickel incorporation protein HypB [Lentisphaeria bacterium]|nr:hydrogenase nickel incorporation protein HypB [Candidatus Neomarinimicrobiota bacterium]MCF7841945.1 hydrogenase nickel incorporation protein HypB [Lentisphaeria bacterium]
MCDTCGCGDTNHVTIRKPIQEHDHHSDPTDQQEHGHTTINLEQDILSENNRLAERNRGYFEAKEWFVINLVSSPGSGKTTLLEQTIPLLQGTLSVGVIEGDQQTMRDAARIEQTGAAVVQINTGTGCHLDAQMVRNAVNELDLQSPSLVFIENVGNLICPALFDLGEAHKVVIISVTEGDDKPYKYPTMFAAADICIINKTDLCPHVDFDLEKCMEAARSVNHHLKFFPLSAKTGEGLEDWLEWLKMPR